MKEAKAGRFFIKRVLLLASFLIAVSVAAFTLLELSPIDPVQAYVGADMSVSSEQREQIAEHWGLNKPPVERFYAWFTSVIKGDLGTSMIFRKPVVKVIGEKFKASLFLMLVAWLASGVIGFTLGIVAGMNQGTWIDSLIKSYCLMLETTPVFWVGLLLLLVFSVQLGWFPIGLSVPIGVIEADVTLLDRLRHVILPAMTLSLVGVANIALFTRQKMTEVLSSDYVLFARARGEKGWGLVVRHGARNVLLPFITLQFASISELFGGAVLAEQVFSYPGLGRTTVQAGLSGDVPLLLGIVLFSAMFVFVGNTLADLSYGVIDPRIRERIIE